MPLATCLVNEHMKEYYKLYEYSSKAIETILTKIEHSNQWDVSNHTIYICLFNDGLLNYVDTTGAVREISRGGEIIHERISLI
jgi:hypothetical protein